MPKDAKNFHEARQSHFESEKKLTYLPPEAHGMTHASLVLGQRVFNPVAVYDEGWKKLSCGKKSKG
jgi:hypothetical protein